MGVQNAVPHPHGEGLRVSRFTGTGSSSQWAVLLVFSNAKVRVYAVLPRVPWFVTALPLPLSLVHKSSALPGLVWKAGTAGLKHLLFSSTGTAGPAKHRLPPREKIREHVPYGACWRSPSLPTCHSYAHFVFSSGTAGMRQTSTSTTGQRTRQRKKKRAPGPLDVIRITHTSTEMDTNVCSSWTPASDIPIDLATFGSIGRCVESHIRPREGHQKGCIAGEAHSDRWTRH